MSSLENCKAQIQIFFLKITTLHGLYNLTLKNRKRTVWIIIFFANIVFTVFLIVVVKIRYNSNQIYTKMDPTCNVNQVPFPTVSICNANGISMQASENIRNILKSNGRRQSEITSFLLTMQKLTHSKRNDVGNFTEIMNILKRNYFSVDTIMMEIHQNCDNLVLFCEYNLKMKNCRDVFKLIKTFNGYCCAFNHGALGDGREDPTADENDVSNQEYDERKGDTIIYTPKSGKNSGLTVLFNVQPQDYPPWSKPMFYGALIILSDPNDYPETSVIVKYIEMSESVDLVITPQIFIGDSSLRRVSVEERNCWFHDEVYLMQRKRYSFETCRTECKMRSVDYECGCVPYKYPREKETRICELSDLPCLHNYKVMDNNRSCHCLLECSDKKYKVTQDSMPLNIKDLAKHIRHTVKHLNTSEVSLLKVYYDQSMCSCFNRTLLMDFNRLLATYGGVFSLSLGGSIVTLVELTYLLVLSMTAVIFRMSWKYQNRSLHSKGYAGRKLHGKGIKDNKVTQQPFEFVL